jgi:ribosomal silencing factor RsfS
MWALIVTSISVLYDEYIILLQWVSHNLNSIQKAVTQECCTTTIIIMQQSHMNNMNWELTEHIIVAVTETEERHRAQ